MEGAYRCPRKSPPRTSTTNGPRFRPSTPSSCERLAVHDARRIYASTRATISTTSAARFEHAASARTFVDGARSRGVADEGEQGAGSWSERTLGTTGFRALLIRWER